MRAGNPYLVHHLVDAAAEHAPRDIACVANDTALDYGRLSAEMEDFATGLTALGCRRYDRIAVYLPKLAATVTALFGPSRAGCISVPINPLLKPLQVRHILNDCAATLLVTTASRLQVLQEILADVPSIRHVVVVDRVAEDPSEMVVDWRALMATGTRTPVPHMVDTDVASILYTSGSTGRPKGVVLSHRNMVVGACSVAEYLGNHSSDRILSVLPLSFDAGLSQLTTAFKAGARVVLMDYLLPKDVVRVCEKEQITGITGVPPLWMQLAALEWPDSAARHVRYFANTGGKMPRATLDRLRQQFPAAQPFLMYGLTEAFRSTFLPPCEVDRRPDSIGKAIPNAEVLVMREDGTEAGPNEPGELVHRGPLVAQGYWNDPERTRERFRPIAFAPPGVPNEEVAVWSGDTVVKDDEGFLYFVGRKDDMIKTSGYRVSPTELEEAAHASGVVSEVAAIGVDHPELGQAIILFAVRTGADAREDQLMSALRSSLPAYMIPHKVLWRSELPRNPNGKINRLELRESVASVFSGERN